MTPTTVASNRNKSRTSKSEFLSGTKLRGSRERRYDPIYFPKLELPPLENLNVVTRDGKNDFWYWQILLQKSVERGHEA
jgi:hypothetical protein